MGTPSVYKIQQSILVVDDDPDIGIALNDLLTSEGFDVEVVDTGNGAITAVKESGYSSFFSDLPKNLSGSLG